MGVIDREQLDRALAEQRKTGKRLGRTLVEMQAIEETSVVEALCRQLQLDRWDPLTVRVEGTARQAIPRDLAFKAKAVPLRWLAEQDVILIATSDPLAPSAAKVMRTLADKGTSVRWLMATEGEIDQGLTGFREASDPAVLSAASAGELQVVRGRPTQAQTLLADDAVLEVMEVFEEVVMTDTPPPMLIEPRDVEPEPVALARVAIQRRSGSGEGGVKEIVSPSAQQDDREQGGLGAGRSLSQRLDETETDDVDSVQDPITSPDIQIVDDGDSAEHMYQLAERFAGGAKLNEREFRSVLRVTVKVLLSEGFITPEKLRRL